MKKKNLKLLVIIVLSVFVNVLPVYATDYASTVEKVNNKKGVLLCEYKSPNTGDGTKIFIEAYQLKNSPDYEGFNYGFKYDNAWWSVYTIKNGGNWEGNPLITNTGNFQTLFEDSRIHYNKKDNWLTNEETFKCPKYAYLDLSSFVDIGEICLSENDNRCNSDDFTREAQELSSDADTIFNDIDGFASTTVYNSDNITFDEFRESSSLIDLVVKKTNDYVYTKYFSNQPYEIIVPKAITNYINSLNESDKIINSEKYLAFQTRLKSELAQKVASGEISEEENKSLTAKIDKDPNEALNIKDSTSIDFQDSTDNSCQGLLGAQLSQYLKNIFTTIQYLGPVLVVVLTIMDFIKTAVSGEKENMQKDFKRFYKRVIYAMLLFFVPLLVNLILSITGVVTPSNCF